MSNNNFCFLFLPFLFLRKVHLLREPREKHNTQERKKKEEESVGPFFFLFGSCTVINLKECAADEEAGERERERVGGGR